MLAHRDANLFTLLLKQVYAELRSDPKTKVFRSVRTCLDMWQAVRELHEGNGRLVYRRIPMIDDAVPMEKV